LIELGLKQGPGEASTNARSPGMENIRGTRRSNMQQLGTTSRGQTDAANSQDDHSNWAMEVYNARKEEELLREAEDGILELDLGEDEAELSQKHLAMAIYYSCKSYNPKVLIAEMLNAWGIQKLVLAEKVGDYLFKLEFSREEEKMKVLDGGPWRHKGDVVILTNYDGFSRPSEIRITSIALWVRFYDLPQAMMKETITKQLGGQLGKFIKMDVRFPGYMRVPVEYPLNKALILELKVKIKSRGLIGVQISLSLT
jgi:hypothetical protein